MTSSLQSKNHLTVNGKYVKLTHMNEQTNELDKQIKKVMTQIAEAASKRDLAAIQRLTQKAAELQELREQMVAIQQRFVSLTTERIDAPVPSMNQSTNGIIRQLPIEVTQGMINENLLTMSRHVKSGKIKVGEQLVIEPLPSGKPFQTVLLRQGKKLQERGKIASFYRAANVKSGDYVLLTETSSGRWTLKKAPEGEYGVARLLRDLV